MPEREEKLGKLSGESIPDGNKMRFKSITRLPPESGRSVVREKHRMRGRFNEIPLMIFSLSVNKNLLGKKESAVYTFYHRVLMEKAFVTTKPNV